MKRLSPPHSRWSLALYVIAALFGIFQMVTFVKMAFGPDLPSGFGGMFYLLREAFGGLLFPAFIGVLGGAVQYLADIRWALLRDPEDHSA